MNNSLVTSIILFATTSICSVSIAADIYDAPGPGYHQQNERMRQEIERVFRTITTDIQNDTPFSGPIIHSHHTSFATPSLPSPFPDAKPLNPNDSTASLSPSIVRAFSVPIRLTIGNTGGVSYRSEPKNQK